MVAEPAELHDLFSQNTAAHVYALCDLEPLYWDHSRWYRRGDATVGLVGAEPGELLVVSAVSTADITGSNALLAELAPSLPDGQLVIGSSGMSEALEGRCQLRWKTNEIRYSLRQHPVSRNERVENLDGSHTSDLERLYAIEPGAAFFRVSMVSHNAFVGVWDEVHETLIAAAGVHVLSEHQRIAAIGSVYVRPDCRGRGLGTQVTVGVLDRLQNRVDTVGLNVSRDNTPARKIYERLGFDRVLDFEEAELSFELPKRQR